jgi:hypothetical protein
LTVVLVYINDIHQARWRLCEAGGGGCPAKKKRQ